MEEKNHYSYEMLDACLHKDVSFFKRFICRMHLRHCAKCAALMKRVKDDNDLFAMAIGALKEKESPNGK